MPLGLDSLPLRQGMTNLLCEGPGSKCFRLNRPRVVSLACLSSFKNVLQPFKKNVKSILAQGCAKTVSGMDFIVVCQPLPEETKKLWSLLQAN